MYATIPLRRAKREAVLTVVGLLVAVVLTALWVYVMVLDAHELWRGDRAQALEHTVFLLIGLGLVWGTLVFLLTRYGPYRRVVATAYPPEREVDRAFFGGGAEYPSLVVLVPSYKEELRVIRMTLLSAALLEYPHKHIALLVDDPVTYRDPDDLRQLQETFELPSVLAAELGAMHTTVGDLYAAFCARREAGLPVDALDVRQLAYTYSLVEEWFGEQQESWGARDHAERFFVEKVFEAGRLRYRAVREEVATLPLEVTPNTLAAYYRRALGIFSVSLVAFQRKQYENLSHEPNKAMNLNSYLSLVGKRYREVALPSGATHLVEDVLGACVFPSADYVLTLDADSILAYDYAKKLVYFLEDPAHARYAVAQTPYNTMRCPFINLERIAGATTDVQHRIHQGFTHFHASYWVGANAVLRFRALDAIREHDTERGFPIARYIQDRTVIEDTESTIDLLEKRWEVYNYLGQMAYSATPPDFGALVIQRRRWANGGLIILPKLVRYLLAGPHALVRRIVETFVRAHYLVSIAVVNVGLLVMLVYPFSGRLHIGYLVALAFIYFGFYAYDLVLLGYRGFDLIRVYAINLLLIPINIAGVAKSLQQLITQKKIPFGRTPKVQGRTAAAPSFILFEFLLMVYLIVGAALDGWYGRYTHMVFSAVNGVTYWYAWSYFIGWTQAYQDIRAWFPARR